MAFIDKIKEIPIVDHAERMGFTLTKKGKYYSLREHDSVMISVEKNCFWRNSTFSSGFKGGAGSVIDFVIEFGDAKDVKEAIQSLATEYGIQRDNYQKVNIPKKERIIVDSGPKREPGDLDLPEKDDNMNAVYNYLINTRKLDKAVVDYFVENDMLYQDKRRNAVFKVERFASLRSTGGKRFVMDVEGCDYNKCFFFKGNENADTLIVGESVIDVMSIMSVYAKYNTDFTQFAYLALSGTNKLGSVFYNLENEPGIKHVVIACDNDQAGRIATQKIIQGLQERNFDGTWKEANAPEGKDWNEFLVMRADDASILQENENITEIGSINDKNKEVDEISNKTLGDERGLSKPHIENFGKIIRDMYELAVSSDNETWFLEKESFEDGEYDQVDLIELGQDIERLQNQYGIQDARNIIERYGDEWQQVEDGEPVVTFYGAFIDIFENERTLEIEQEVNNELIQVAIESTNDYTDSQFHEELVDTDIQNEDGSYGKTKESYRIVTIGGNGLLVPLNHAVYASYEEAREVINQTSSLEMVSYDELVNQVGENIPHGEEKSVNSQEGKEFSYYSILRPIAPGTYPKDGMKELQNFEERKFVEEIGREAYGRVTYDRMLSPAELDQYDLVAIPSKNLNLEQRLQGQQLEAAKNMINSLREIGNVDDEEKGIVNLYYSTDPKMTDNILKTEKMRSEDFMDARGVLLSTEPEPLKDGDVVIKLSVPVENLKLNNYDIESEKATFYLQSDERIFSVKDYDIEIVDVPHHEEHEEQINNDLKTAKEESVDGRFERFLENLEYTDVEDQILMFDFAKRKDESLFPIDFADESGNIFETEEQSERIINFIYEKSNQRILFEWFEKQGADFDDLIDIIHGEIPSFEKPDAYKYYICQEEWSNDNLPEGVVDVEHLNEKQSIENSIEDAFAIASFNRKLTPEEQWSNHLIRAYKLETRKENKDSFKNVEQSQGNKPREKIPFANASKDDIKDHLVKGIQNIMNSDDYKNWLNTGSKLFYNNYSFNNAMLIWMQKDGATHVMGYEKWKDFGRAVQKGAKGAKILMPVMAYEKTEGKFFRDIITHLEEQFKKEPDLAKAEYRLFTSQVQFTMNRSGSIGLVVNGKERGIFPNHDEVKKFISNNILGKVPMKYTIGTVFDAKDTYVPEFLWVSKGYTKEELVLNDKGEPIKSKKGEYKIYNTPERQARFKPALDTSIVVKDPEKMEKLMEVLIAVSEKNGIPVYKKEKNEDDVLRDGASGYFSRRFDEQHPKGYIVIDKNMEITEMCSVMIHEMGHSDMHGSLEKIAELSKEMGEEATSSIRELQAESVAYMTASVFGIETSTKSFQYLANYAQGFDVQGLQKSMDAIYRECKKLTTDISEELEARGLNLDLSKMNPEEMITEQKVEKISQEFMGFSLKREEALDEIQNELPSLVIENKDDKNIIAILKKQKDNVLSQLDDIEVIQKEVNNLEKADTRQKQDECIQGLEKAKERIELKVVDFDKLTDEFISYRNTRQGTLREEFQKSPTKVLNKLSEQYPQLNKLSKSQIHYIATSKFIDKNYRELLNNNPEAFINVAIKRAEAVTEIASKNGTFVEINFCEQWTEKPIFKQGTLCHPKVANMIIKNAEMQMENLRHNAQQKGEYFPYSKCDLTVYYSHEKGERQAFNTRVDIGDGFQKDLISHIESISLSNSKGLIENIKSAEKELKSKDKIVLVEIDKKDLCISNEVEKSEDRKSCSMVQWKEKLSDKKKAVESEKVEGKQKMNSKERSSFERD